MQNYINAKYELFQLAFPNAQERDRVEFYRETTEGFLNKYVRDQMFCFDANCVEAFGARVVNVVQIERRQQHQQDGWADPSHPAHPGGQAEDPVQGHGGGRDGAAAGGGERQ